MKIKNKLTKKSDGAEIIASINDILTDILLRLPIKSLVRFKLVSKSWHALITNPRFCHLRSLNLNPAIGLYLPFEYVHFEGIRDNLKLEYLPFSDKNSTNSTLREFNFIEDPSGVRILQSCNGLLLCCSLRERGIDRKYYVCNPTTNKFSTLPDLENRSWTSGRTLGMSLAFDPAKSPHYRVICSQRFETDSDESQSQYQIQMYSSETGPWRVCGGPFTAQPNFENGVYWNGAIHWINNDGGDSLYFNIEDQVIETMPIPPFQDGLDWRGDYYFGESCGHLHYIEICSPTIQFNVYELKRDYSEWFIKYQVDLSPVVAAYPRMIRDNYNPEDYNYYAFSIFTLVRGEGHDGSFLVLQIPGKAIKYNLGHNNGFEMFHEFEGDEVYGGLRFHDVNGFQYIESLCCV